MIEEIVIKMAQLRPVKISLIVKWTNRSSFDDWSVTFLVNQSTIVSHNFTAVVWVSWIE